MRARAAVVAACSPATGRTTYPTLRSDPPLTLRSTLDGVHLVGTSAGPLTGDDLGLTVEVGEGTDVTIRSVAASLIQPGVTDRPSTLTIDVTVGPGATLRWLPQPAVLVRGCDHETIVRISLAEDATLLWRDEVVLGRHDEAGGSLRQQLIVDVAGEPLLRNELVAGPRWPGSEGPAGTDGAKALGSLLLAGPAATATAPATAQQNWPRSGGGTAKSHRISEVGSGVRTAVLPLDGPGVLVTALADRPSALGAALDAVVADLSQRAGAPRRTNDHAA